MKAKELAEQLLQHPDLKVYAEGGCCGGQCMSPVVRAEEVRATDIAGVATSEDYVQIRVDYYGD